MAAASTKRALERALVREKKLRSRSQAAVREHARSQRELGRAMMSAERDLAKIARAPAKSKKSKSRSR